MQSAHLCADIMQAARDLQKMIRFGHDCIIFISFNGIIYYFNDKQFVSLRCARVISKDTPFGLRMCRVYPKILSFTFSWFICVQRVFFWKLLRLIETLVRKQNNLKLGVKNSFRLYCMWYVLQVFIIATIYRLKFNAKKGNLSENSFIFWIFINKDLTQNYATVLWLLCDSFCVRKNLEVEKEQNN
jgi:hypothetical protein